MWCYSNLILGSITWKIFDCLSLYTVPSAGPDGVTANATSSTTIVVRWKEVPSIHQNGIIEGYKIVYVGKLILVH